MDSFAQELANELGIPVTAPTDRVFVDSTKAEVRYGAEWVTYYPNKKNYQTKTKYCTGVGANDDC